MQSISAVGGLNNAVKPTQQNTQSGPPDHAKAWGWRAKQAASAEDTQATSSAVVTEAATEAETTDVVAPTNAVDQISPEAAAALPPPSEADMESVILGLITGFSETADVDTTPLYNEVKALFG